jgi:hypothetical protein
VTNAYCTSKHGAQIDNCALARKNNITLRLDELNAGVSTLLQTASTTTQSTLFATPPKYRFAIYSTAGGRSAAMQACASPGLLYDAAIGSDLGQALAALLAAVTQSGHLTQ